jgi:DNA-binding CsgD family transcriptional regulator
VAEAERIDDLRFRIRAHALLGFVALSAGDGDAALVELDRAHVLFREAGYDDPGVVRFLPDLVEALVLGGERDRAAAVQAALADRGAALDRPYALATGARCRAVLLAGEDRAEDAVAAALEAVEHHARLPQPFELARTQLVLGRLLRRVKAKREARAALSAALATFERLGAAQWAGQARAELGRISGRAPGVGGLTPTEAQVARLAAEGYGNQEIASRLFVTLKTVEGHLTRVYDKLGVRSRGELARRSRTGDFPDVSAEAGS